MWIGWSTNLLLQILNGVFITKVVPTEWLVSMLIPVFQREDSSDANNYRDVALISAFVKLYNRMLYGDPLRVSIRLRQRRFFFWILF